MMLAAVYFGSTLRLLVQLTVERAAYPVISLKTLNAIHEAGLVDCY